MDEHNESRLDRVESRLQELERHSHPPVQDVPDAADIERCFRRLEERIEHLERGLVKR